MSDTERVGQAIARIYEELPDLVEGDWREFEAELTVLLRQLEAADEADEEAVRERVAELLGRHPRAHRRFQEELKALKPERVRGGAEAGKPAGAQKLERYTVVPIFFGTDRKRHRLGGFTAERSEEETLSFGVSTVSIPDDHRMGQLEKPRWWKLQFRADPKKNVVRLSLDVLERDEFLGRGRQALAEAGENEALVFIHGYNVTFGEALLRTAQVAYDLHFGGLALAYSWPSEGDLKKYTVDETNVGWTRPHLDEFLRLVMTELGVETIHVIAHSMGNRALAEIIPDLDPAELPAGAAKLREVVFAAPDIDAGSFRQLARRFAGRADRLTLYASSKDKALQLSKKVHGYARAGDAGEALVVADGLDTVDASEVDTGFLGHSYYGDNRSVLSDIFHLIRNRLEPPDRGLRKREFGGRPYWLFSP